MRKRDARNLQHQGDCAEKRRSRPDDGGKQKTVARQQFTAVSSSETVHDEAGCQAQGKSDFKAARCTVLVKH